MNKLYTLIIGLTVGAASFGQVVVESDLSSWTAGLPDGWMGSKSTISPADVTEQTFGAMHGTSMAQLFNPTTGHKRFTTQDVAVTGGETYEIKIWMTGTPGSELRTGFYDGTNDSYNTYGGYFDVFAETGGDITMLSQTVVVAPSCSTGQFILSIRNTDAMVGIVIDSVSIAVTAPVVADEVSIYDIQYSTTAPYISDYADMVVATSGIVTGVFLTGADIGRFFIQDGDGAWNGIYIYDNGTPVSLGDSVTVTGTVVEFFELTEINAVTSIVVHSSDNVLPTPVEIMTSEATNEEYEGVLVKVINATCTNDDAGFGQFEVNDGSGVRLIDDEMFAYSPTIGNYYTITGVTFLSFGDVKIYPRMISDIEVTGYAGIEEHTNEMSLYPNPANSFVTLTVPATTQVSIYNMIGELVYNANGNIKVVDVSNFATGVYQVVLTSANETRTQQLVVN